MGPHDTAKRHIVVHSRLNGRGLGRDSTLVQDRRLDWLPAFGVDLLAAGAGTDCDGCCSVLLPDKRGSASGAGFQMANTSD